MSMEESIANQWFVEPTYCTKLLIEAERFDGVTLDPSCGQGNIVQTMIDAGLRAVGMDIVERSPGARWFGGKADFLKDAPPRIPDNIVCNPPFFRAKGTEAFIRRALEIATRKVAMFTETKFLAGQGRANGLFAETPPDRIWIVTPRPSCPPGQFLLDGGKDEDGKSDWCWLVFDKTLPKEARGQTRLMWLRGESRRKPKLQAQDEQQNAA